MTIRKRCNEGSCTNGRKCLEHLRFDVMWRGKRYRMPANDFAIPRMEPGKQRPIQSMEEARDWERLFIGEIKVDAIRTGHRFDHCRPARNWMTSRRADPRASQFGSAVR